MPSATIRELLEPSGCQTRRWNPKMRRFFGERNGIYIINHSGAAAEYLEIGERNGSVLFVGTKKQCQDAVDTHVYVNLTGVF